jgi:hypothetical protein
MLHVDTPQGLCHFGLTRCDITPPVGIYHRLWGAAVHDQAKGIHRPLTATSMAFQAADESPSPQTEQVVVAMDLCLLGAREMEALLEAIASQNQLHRDQITVTFSHTHAGGWLGLERRALPGGDLIAPYLEHLTVAVAAIVREARRTVQPVTISFATGHCPLAGHRDLWDEDSHQFVCGFNPDGPADDTVLVGRITNAGGATIATLVNYACHPTTLAWQNTLISPDYPGAMREVVEQATGAPCVFLQGASGDLGPREGFVGDVAVADRNGRQLGYAALAALEALPPPLTRFRYTGPVVSGATLGTWAHSALDADRARQIALWRRRAWTTDLPYRAELLTSAQVEVELARLKIEDLAACQAADQAKARTCRALVERMTRWQTRLGTLPPGPTFPMPITLWQIGDAWWLAVEGEHYQQLQQTLRQRFAGVPIVVVTLANGSRPVYLAPADTYGKGIYQESIAVLAPGCLEGVIEAVGRQMEVWRAQE